MSWERPLATSPYTTSMHGHISTSYSEGVHSRGCIRGGGVNLEYSQSVRVLYVYRLYLISTQNHAL